jgi:hypothetical protein
MCEWVQSIYVETPADQDFATKLDRVVARQRSTRRPWVGIDGVGGIGKTEMLLNEAIRRSAWSSEGELLRPVVNGYPQMPVLIVEASAAERGAGLYRAICHGLRIPTGGSEAVLLRRLIDLLPLYGNQVLFIDDAHFYRRRSDTTQLTDTLRASLRLPTTLVYAGAGLEDSALLKRVIETGRAEDRGHESVEQLIRRARIHSLRRLVLPQDADNLKKLVERFAKKVGRAIPGFEFTALRSSAVMRDVAHLTDGLPGAILTTLKDGVEEVLVSGRRDLTADDLEVNLPSRPGKPVAL